MLWHNASLINSGYANTKQPSSISELLELLPKNEVIVNNMILAWSKINNPSYKKIICSISGGSDSDILLDICTKCDKDKKIEYIWIDTGLEYQATKDHIKYLEDKYNISIKPYKASKPIPISCRDSGQPFISKMVSEYVYRLQKHKFQWENDTYENLIQKYPKCQSALRWWCGEKGEGSHFNIQQNKWLREFIMAHPPTFKISAKCCDHAKKNAIKGVYKELGCDLAIVGVRKAEGGARATAYKSCFDSKDGEQHDNYRPLFWYKDSDKQDYKDTFEIEHSACYSEYGLKRTGCAGCPFGRNFQQELEVIKEYEPKFYRAVMNIFGDSYEYTRQYKDFCEQMDEKYGNYTNYINGKLLPLKNK